MADRWTYKDAVRSFNRFAKAMDRTTTQWVETDDPQHHYRAVIGAWSLDYNPIYGGCVITEIVTDGGGITHPLGEYRATPREFCRLIDFALRTLEAAPAPAMFS